jgi:hypothetical protein
MKNSLLIAALSIFSIAQAQQIDRSVRPKAGAAPEVKIKESETFRTASGITVVLSETTSSSFLSIAIYSPSLS